MEKREIKYEGSLALNGVNIPCYVLEDGTRILSGNQMQEVLKLFPENTVVKSGSRLARLLNYKALNDLIVNKYKVGHFEPIECYKGKTKINGYEATILVDLCDVMLQARQTHNLTDRQKIIADQCEILVRSFAKVGIIALVDEATSYQYDREKLELQAILETFISKEILDWQPTFHLSFYKEIFRLWDIPFTPQNIKKKPIFIGKLTKELVYKNLPKGIFVFNALKEKTPKTKSGNLKYRLHSSLTQNIGREHLVKVINTIEAYASISDTKKQFLRMIGDKYGQKEIPFLDVVELEQPKRDKSKPLGDFDITIKKFLDTPPPPKK